MIGALLGGALNRYGERSFDQLQRDRQLEDWGRQTSLSTLIGHFEKNYENMLPEEQEAMLSQIESQIPGAKKGSLSPLIGGVKAMHAVLPPPPEPYVPPQQERTKLDEPRPISAPIYQPMPTQEIDLPAQTPGQVKSKRLSDQQAAERARMAQEVSGISQLPEEYKRMIIGGVYGMKTAPAYEVGMGNVAQRAQAAQQRAVTAQNALDFKAGQLAGAPRFVLRGGEQIPIYRRGQIETYIDPVLQVERQYKFQPGDKVYEKSTGGIQLIQDDNATYAVNKQGAMTGQPGSVTKIPGLTGRPKPQSQLVTTTTPEGGPQLGEYVPGRGKSGNIKNIGPGVKGTVAPIESSTSKEIAGLGTAAKTLTDLKTSIPTIATGPVWGRLRNVEIRHLGGWGTTPDEVKVASQMNILMRTAFDTAGASLTEGEKDIFRGIYPTPNDTVETALTKIDASMKFLQDRLEIRKGLLTPMQRSQTQFPTIGGPAAGSGELSVTAPNGKVYTFPSKEAADKFRASIGAK